MNRPARSGSIFLSNLSAAPGATVLCADDHDQLDRRQLKAGYIHAFGKGYN